METEQALFLPRRCNFRWSTSSRGGQDRQTMVDTCINSNTDGMLSMLTLGHYVVASIVQARHIRQSCWAAMVVLRCFVSNPRDAVPPCTALPCSPETLQLRDQCKSPRETRLLCTLCTGYLITRSAATMCRAAVIMENTNHPSFLAIIGNIRQRRVLAFDLR